MPRTSTLHGLILEPLQRMLMALASSKAMMTMDLLLIEYSQMLGDGLQVMLQQRGLHVDWVRSGHAAMQSIKTTHYDMLLLGLINPWGSGLELLSRLRKAKNSVPVLVLTARSDVLDPVAALDAGADDYMISPFEPEELCARIRALHRRHNDWGSPLMQHGELVLDPWARIVTMQNDEVPLSNKEFDILQILLENRGRVISRGSLGEKIYALDDDVQSNTIEVHIHHLRKKLGNHSIRTVRGLGYVIEKVC